MNKKSLSFSEAVPVTLAGYAKRILEGRYDAIFQSEYAKGLKNSKAKVKYGLEILLYTLTAVFEQKFPENTLLKKFIKEVLSDSGSEISKRIINGQNQPKRMAETNLNDLTAILLEFDEKSLKTLSSWLVRLDSNERLKMLDFISTLNQKQINKILELDQKTKLKLQLLIQGRKSKQSENLANSICQSIDTATKKIKLARKRFNQNEGGKQ